MFDRQPHICITLVLQYLDEYDLYCCSCACRVLHDVAEPLTKVVKRGTLYDMIIKRQVYSFEANVGDFSTYRAYSIHRLMRLATLPVQLYAIYKMIQNKRLYHTFSKQCIRLRCYNLLKKMYYNAYIVDADIAMWGAYVNDERILSLIDKRKYYRFMINGYVRAGNVAMLKTMDLENSGGEKLRYHAYMSRNETMIKYIIDKFVTHMLDDEYLLPITIIQDDVQGFMKYSSRYMDDRTYCNRMLKWAIEFDAVNIVRRFSAQFGLLTVGSHNTWPIPSKEMCKALASSPVSVFEFLLQYMMYDIVIIMRGLYGHDVCKELDTLTEDSDATEYMKLIK